MHLASIPSLHMLYSREYLRLRHPSAPATPSLLMIGGHSGLGFSDEAWELRLDRLQGVGSNASAPLSDAPPLDFEREYCDWRWSGGGQNAWEQSCGSSGTASQTGDCGIWDIATRAWCSGRYQNVVGFV